jgi:hypothetical protein
MHDMAMEMENGEPTLWKIWSPPYTQSRAHGSLYRNPKFEVTRRGPKIAIMLSKDHKVDLSNANISTISLLKNSV